jgi:hypothetical protein
MTENELLDLHIATAKERHVRAIFTRPQYYKDSPNNNWKLTINLETIKDMGRMDLYNRMVDRQKAIKKADAECFKQHGRYVTQEEFESAMFNK